MIKNYRQMGLDARYTPMIFRDSQTREWNMPRYTNKVEKELLDAWKENGMVSWSDLGRWIDMRLEQNPKMPYKHSDRYWYYY